MRRRDFITVLGGAAAASPLPVDAQQQPIPVIGFLSTVAPEGFSDRLRGFREGLREAGYIEGNNVAIEFRWAENRLERLPELGADLVRRQVSVIVVGARAPRLADDCRGDGPWMREPEASNHCAVTRLRADFRGAADGGDVPAMHRLRVRSPAPGTAATD